MIETISPIVDAIENNLYSGKYDFNDSSPPTSESFFQFSLLK
jgi:hypothetical protein